MASTYQIKVHWYDERMVFDRIPVATASVIAYGDLVTVESNSLALLDSADDDQYFCGIALGASASGETATIPVAMGDVVGEGFMASAAYRFGAGIKYEDTSDNGELVADGSANTIGFVVSDNSSSTTSAKIRFNAFELGKYFTVSA